MMSYLPEQEHPADTRPLDAEDSGGQLWPPEQTFPEAVDVGIVFHGLFLFARAEGGNVCEVGVHRDAQHHNFRLFVWEVEQGLPSPVKLPDGPYSSIVIDVVRPHAPGVRFFQPQTGEMADNSWALVPDLEGSKFYDQKLDKIQGSLKPIITIRHGLFFTFMPTDFEFVREAEGNTMDSADLGRIAFLIGTALSHDGGRVTLTIDGQELTLEATGGKQYIIYFWNSCLEDGRPCEHEPRSENAERRNDFHLYYRAVKVPKGKSRYLLRLKSGEERLAASAKPAAPLVLASMNFVDLGMLNKFGPFSTHDAPCGGSGNGRTTDGLGS
jgi:hypothetical protein